MVLGRCECATDKQSSSGNIQQPIRRPCSIAAEDRAFFACPFAYIIVQARNAERRRTGERPQNAGLQSGLLGCLSELLPGVRQSNPVPKARLATLSRDARTTTNQQAPSNGDRGW